MQQNILFTKTAVTTVVLIIRTKLNVQISFEKRWPSYPSFYWRYKYIWLNFTINKFDDFPETEFQCHIQIFFFIPWYKYLKKKIIFTGLYYWKNKTYLYLKKREKHVLYVEYDLLTIQQHMRSSAWLLVGFVMLRYYISMLCIVYFCLSFCGFSVVFIVALSVCHRRLSLDIYLVSSAF